MRLKELEELLAELPVSGILAFVSNVTLSTLSAYIGCKLAGEEIEFKLAFLIGLCSVLAGFIPVIGFIANAIVFFSALYYFAGIELSDIGLISLVNLGLYYFIEIIKAGILKSDWFKV